MLGILEPKMLNVAPKIRDRLTVIYATQTKEPFVASTFYVKKVVVTSQLLSLLEEAKGRALLNEARGEGNPAGFGYVLIKLL